MDNTIIKVEHITKTYKIYENAMRKFMEITFPFIKSKSREFHALENISFEVKKGETVGIIGKNGSGKSTLLKIITNVTSANKGNVEINGKVSALLELGAGFNPNYTGIENIYLNGTMMGYNRVEMEQKIEGILKFADIGDFIYQPVKTYSSGMFARLAFAVAINVEPEILIVDEALSVGDIFFQNKCYKKIEELRKKGTTVLFVSHDIHAVKEMCSKALWLEKGKMKSYGDCVSVCNEYTNKLLDTQQVKVENKVEEIIEIPQTIQYSKESILCEDVKILSCYVRNMDGKVVKDCIIEEMYEIVYTFKTNIDLKDCIVGFVLETKKGQWIINSNNLINSTKHYYSVAAGSTNKVVFRFKMPPLIKGEYILGIAVSNGTMEEYKVHTWLYGVEVITVVNEKNNSGLVNIDTSISVINHMEM